METATRLEARYDPIGFGGACSRQLGLLWQTRRPLLLLVGLLGVLALAGDPWSRGSLARFLTVWPVWVVFAGPIWGFAVFHDEGPSRRLYHWSLPVARDVHTLARLAAGATWLWLTYLVLIGFALLVAGLDGNAWQLAEVNPAGWVNYFTGALIGYLAVSLLTVASDHPIRWFFGILFLVPVLVSLLEEWTPARAFLRTVVRPLSHPEWGLGVTMVGALGMAVERVRHAMSGGADPMTRGSVEVDLPTWWLATLLWVLLLAVLVWLLARRHPDTLPRWRWPS